MKGIKNHKLLLTVLLILIFAGSCRYKEGPDISFRSVEKRVAGKYHLSKLEVNGIDFTQNFRDSCNCDFNFQKDNQVCRFINCNANSRANYFHAAYEIVDDKKVLEFRCRPVNQIYPLPDTIIGYPPFDAEILVVYEIRRLTDKEMILEGYCNDKKYRVEFKEFD